MSNETPRPSDYLLVLAFCLVLFSCVLAVGGPLTMHEGVLSQTSRQMAADHDWIVPHFGEAPWLERPPLPQWITVGISYVIGRCDQEWIVRLGSALSGTLAVLLTVWLGGALLGRAAGILGGLILATMYEFLRYSTLAEADIFLCPIVTGCMTLFAYLELVRPRSPSESRNFFGPRPWPVLGFFVLLGMTNLAKGVVFGTAMTLVPIGSYLLLAGRIGPILRYCWLWGWLAFAVVALAWPIAVYQRYDNVLEVWHYDLFGRLTGNYLAEPFWYYFVCMFWVVLPWPLAAIAGLRITACKAIFERNSPQRLLWCWAIMTPAVFSFAHGKHHHYMLHFLAPWALLAGQGLVRGWQNVQSWPGWLRLPVLPFVAGVLSDVALAMFTPWDDGSFGFLVVVLLAWPTLLAMLWWFAVHPRGQTALVGFFAVLLLLYWGGFSYKGRFLHRSNDDTAFLRQAVAEVPPHEPLLVHAWDEALEGLRVLFYCPPNTMLLHNMTFLRDDRLTSPSLWVLARYKDWHALKEYGEAEPVLKSKRSRREEGPEDRWTLFHLKMRDDVRRVPNHEKITPMQAMYRAEGPRLD